MNSEWECFLRAQAGDESAWRVLIGQYQPRLTALALLITGSAPAADDVVQETFVRALEARIKQFTGSVQGFLATIAYRLAVKEARRVRRNVELETTEIADTANGPLDDALNNERDRLVAGVIGELDAEHRDVLVLRLYGGYSYNEISETLQIPLGTVKSRIFHSVRNCRDRLKQKGVIQ